MKTYLLRTATPVEPQNAARPPRSRTRAPAAPPAPAATRGPVLFIGLDVHNDSIAVSLAPWDSPEVRRYGIIGGQHDDALKLLKKLAAAHPGAAVKFCYEAGPRGYATHSLDRGVNVKALQEAMGHERVETTMGYSHADALSVPSPL